MKGAVCAVMGGVSWGLSGSMGQYMFQTLGMDSKWLVPIRLFLAGVVLMAYSLGKYKKEVLAPWKKFSDAWRLLVYGIPGVAFCQFFYFLTIQKSSAAMGTIMQDLSPIMILVAICIASRRAPKLFEIFSIVLAIVGVFLLTTHGNPSTMQISFAALGAGLLSALGVAIYNLAPGALLQKYPVAVLQAWSFLMGGVIIGCIFRSWTIAYSPNLIGIFGIAFVVLVGNISAFGFYSTGLKYIGPERAILFGFSEPITAAVISVLFLGGRFTWIDFIGFAMIFAMLAMNSYGNLRRKAQTKAQA